MREALYALFRHAMRGCVELGWTDRNGALNRAKQYDVGDLDDLVAFAARINENPNCNTYISAGLRRPDIDRDHRANDADVETVAALKVDCDTPGCLEAALKTLIAAGMAPSLAFFTGKHPHPRGSLWWVLDEPEPDLARVRKLETALAYWLNSDPKVINPSRVMRLPGSVAWPIKAGRVVEMTGAVTDAQTRSAPYTIDEIEHHLRRAGRNTESPGTHAGSHTGAAVLDFSAAAKTLELSDLLTAAREPHRWHQSALQATAHLIGRGTPPDVTVDLLTPMLTLAGYVQSQTREELTVMVKGAVQKGWLPAPPAPLAPSAPEPEPIVANDAKSPFVTIEDMLNRPPPVYIVDGYLTEGGLSVLWGASGAFKSFVAIDLALCVASGLEWHGKRVEKRPVIYVCAEGQYGFGVRALAWRQTRGESADLSGFHVLPVPVNFMEPANLKLLIEAIRRFIPEAINNPLIVIDTMARNFGDGDENATKDMNRFITSAGLLQADLCAHVLLIHHTGKDDTKGERGAYSLRGAVDTSLKLVRDGQSERVSLEHFKQKEGPENDPISLRMAAVEAVHPATGELLNSLVPVLDEATPSEKTSAAVVRLGRNERLVLALLNDAHPLRFSQILAQTGIDKGTLGRVLRSIIDKKLVAKRDDAYEPVGGVSNDE